MEGNKSKNSLFRAMLMITVIPIFLFAVIVVWFSTGYFTKAMHQEVQNGLRSMGYTTMRIYDTLYPGDYKLVQKGKKDSSGLIVMKGDWQITDHYAIIDALKEETGLDYTILYSNIKVATTIKDRDGERMTDVGSDALVLEKVLYDQEEQFYPEIEMNGESYFAYYVPLHNSDGECVGMIFIGKPTAQVKQSLRECLIPVIVIAIVGILVAGVVSVIYARRLGSSIRKLESFLGKVEQGNLTIELEAEVLNRSDEVGEMGHYVVNVQRALQEMKEQDSLTKVNNRRYGEKRLKQLQKKSQSTGQAFTIALGDIDFFKKLNDTYGYECGDMVLKNVSLLLKKHMAGNGFVARWGGEEFLIVYEKDDMESARAKLNELLEELRIAKVQYNDDMIGVTMTFGMAAGNVDDLDKMISEADECLYQGKADGRDQVVSTET